MTIHENISLKELSTFRTGGVAAFFAAVSTIEDLREAVLFARSKKIKIFILGGGSNILISDKGFSGLVIKMEIKGVELEKKETEAVLIAGAGESWDDIVSQSVIDDLSGLENLSYIPGTVGAAPVQNIGAYGAEVKDAIFWVEVVDIRSKDLEVKRLSNKECRFAYRDSIFKKPEGKNFIVVRVAFALTPFHTGLSLNTSYKDIQEYIKNNDIKETDLTPLMVSAIVTDIRKKKLPDVREYGTAGSFFKNPIISKKAYEELLKKYPDMPSFPSLDKEGAGGVVKIPAGWLLDKICGFKGYRDGTVGVYQNQALVLVNFGGATSAQVLDLAKKMIESVKEKTSIQLEQEVQIIEG